MHFKIEIIKLCKQLLLAPDYFTVVSWFNRPSTIVNNIHYEWDDDEQLIPDKHQVMGLEYIEEPLTEQVEKVGEWIEVNDYYFKNHLIKNDFAT